MSDLGNKEIFAKNLRYYMNLYNKTRNEVANDNNVSYTTLASWITIHALIRLKDWLITLE